MMNTETDLSQLRLVLRAREAHDVARETMNLLSRELLAVAEATKIYAFKNRLKSPIKILSKVERKRNEAAKLQAEKADLLASNDLSRKEEKEKLLVEVERLSSYEPESVTDAFGCRYVVLFPEQIPEIIKALLQRIHAFNERTQPQIKLRELIVYTNRRKDDELSIAAPVMRAYQETEFARSPAAEGAVVKDDESTRNAYTSVHATFELQAIVNHPGRGTCFETGFLEVQIRDIFEEAWGEIDHYVRYSEKDGELEEEIEEQKIHRSTLSRTLRILKEEVHGCSSIAQNVFSSYRAIQGPEAPSMASRSATPRQLDRDAIIEALRGRTALVDLARTAYDRLIRAEEAPSRDEAIAGYTIAATSFEELLRGLNSLLALKLPKRDNRPISYFVRMELANCYMLGEAGQKLQTAAMLFKEVLKEFPLDPIVRFRLARTMIDLEQTEDGYQKAIDLLKECISLIHKDSLTGNEHWVTIAAQVQLSFTLWRLSELVVKAGDQRDKRNDLLKEAAISGYAGYEAWLKMPDEIRAWPDYRQHANKALSNVIYFAAQLIGGGYEDDFINRQNLTEWIEKISLIGATKYRDYYKTEDNLMEAFCVLGNMEEARKLANSVFGHLKALAEKRAAHELSLGEIGEMLHPWEIGEFRSAVEVLTRR
jgi:ppGpp synthetase/RelA/SpoT-type nucleotidyltranferase